MKEIIDINFGYLDAEPYQKKKNKELFNRIFLQDNYLEELLDNDTYFLIGEKGTGKTAYATYLSNNDYKNTFSSIKYIRETDYTKFIRIAKSKHLITSDYDDIWRLILLLLISIEIKPSIKQDLFNKLVNYRKLMNCIKQYYNNAFNPEINQALEIVEHSKTSADLFFRLDAGADAGIEYGKSSKQVKTTFQHEIDTLIRAFKDGLKNIKINNSFIVFIDGLDIKPVEIEDTRYIDCLKGLFHAAWHLNNDYFGDFKDTNNNQIKIVILVRPDIFNQMGLQNSNTKIRDNGVLLSWNTDEGEYKDSRLYRLINGIMAKQQTPTSSNKNIWDYYFPFKYKSKNSFVAFLRYSFSRPRDIIYFLDTMKKSSLGQLGKKRFTLDDFNNCQKDFSDYLLGEIRDYMKFNYTDRDFNLILKFAGCLSRKSKLTYNEYIVNYENFKKANLGYADHSIKFDNANDFLQLLYELNIISYIIESDTKRYYYWSYRERSPVNITPQVAINEKYIFHQGLRKTLNLDT